MSISVLSFPTLVYKTPGSHACDGATFDYLPVHNEDELANAIKRGYYLSLPEAIANEHDMEKIDGLTVADPIETARIPHVADPAIQTLAPNLNITSGVAGQALDHPMDKSGGSPDDLRGLEQPSAHTHDLSDDTTLVGGEAPSPIVDLDSDRPGVDTAGNSSDESIQQGRTRAELEARANELGIDFDARNSNKTLAKLIAEREQQGE